MITMKAEICRNENDKEAIMQTLTEQLSKILRIDLSDSCSSAAYAIMIDGQIIAEDSMGKHPNHRGTYNVGSISKVYCAVAVMQLVEKGILDLDRPVYEYLPRFTMPDKRYKRITLRHCLSHSCSLPGTQWRWLAAGRPREDYYEEVYRFLSHSALHSTPGDFSVYCNDGFTLAEMVVAQVTGMEYGEYCKEYITEPIGAYSSRQSSQRNKAYPHTAIVGMPEESIGPEGAGGIGTTMSDLCKFGQLFLTQNEIISEESKQEINKKQGATFLKEDAYSTHYGLGWDSVAMPHTEYDLGGGVLDKGGGTAQFSSRLVVIPKYNAVLAISATLDCGCDVKEEILQLFAMAMMERGINIWTHCQQIPQQIKETYEGLYLSSGNFFRLTMQGPRADVIRVDSRGGSQNMYANLLFDGTKLIWKPNDAFDLTEHDGKQYLMGVVHERHYPVGVKAEGCRCEALTEEWKARLGKEYIIANVFYDDIVGSSQFNGIRLTSLPEVPELLIASFTAEARKKTLPYFEVPLTPYIDGTYSEVLACGALQLPYHAGRDLLNLYFEEKDGISFCYSSGYLYQDVTSLQSYRGQGFTDSQLNQIYVLDQGLEKLPDIPEGRRILIFNEKLSVIYDSLLEDSFTAVQAGYISLI